MAVSSCQPTLNSIITYLTGKYHTYFQKNTPDFYGNLYKNNKTNFFGKKACIFFKILSYYK